MNCNVTISNEVAEVLKAAEIKDNVLFLKGQLSRDLYTKTNKVLELLSGKWNKKIQGHVFNSSPAEIIKNSLGAGKIENKKKKFQLFETPTEIVEKLIDSLCGIDSTDIVLEPSAGTGRIADAIAKRLNHSSQIHCCEIQDELSEQLEQKGYTLVKTDFLTYFPEPKYGIILMNPPFADGQDVDHVMHAYNNCLGRGGQLAAIMSPSFQFNSKKKFSQFRKFIDDVGAYVTELPEGAFKESGTGTKTVMVNLSK